MELDPADTLVPADQVAPANEDDGRSESRNLAPEFSFNTICSVPERRLMSKAEVVLIHNFSVENFLQSRMMG